MLRALPLLLLTALLAACAGEDDGPASTVAGMTYYEVRVTEQGVEPRDLVLRVPDRAFLVVDNDRTEPCVFTLGPWVRGLAVPPDDSANMGFTVTGNPEDRAAMGCEGRMSGTVTVRDATAVSE
jgi:hypothetical protein